MDERLRGFVERLFTNELVFSGAKLLGFSTGYAKVEVDVDSKMLNLYGEVHGGIIFTLADSTAGTVSRSLSKLVVTKSASITYTSKPQTVKLIAEGYAIHVGRSTVDVRVDVKDDSGRLIASSIYNMFVMADIGESLACEV